MNLSANIGKVSFDHCIMNASGPRCVSSEELRGLGRSKSSAIVLKSMTILPREGNPRPRYFEGTDFTVNSTGLTNLGYKRYAELIPQLKSEFNKPVVASIAGFNQEEYVEMVRAMADTNVDLIEVNLSCPNIIGKPQVGYDFEQSDSIIRAVKDVAGGKTLGVKLPPYFDLVHQQQMAEVLQRNELDFITLINSVGNTLVIDPHKEEYAITPRYGGLGGPVIKPIALANVHRFYELLEDSIPIIGVGGIASGEDVFAHILAGATAVQTASAYAKEGVRVFPRLLKELNEMMEEKGYSSIEDFRGNIRQADDVSAVMKG